MIKNNKAPIPMIGWGPGGFRNEKNNFENQEQQTIFGEDYGKRLCYK